MLYQSEHTLHEYALKVPAKIITSHPTSAGAPTVALRSVDSINGTHFDFSFEALRPGIFRTTFSAPSHPLPPFPSAKRLEPNLSVSSTVNGDVGGTSNGHANGHYNGTLKSTLNRTACMSSNGTHSTANEAQAVIDTAARSCTITVGNTTAVVDWKDAPIVSLFRAGVAKPLYRDLGYRSYNTNGSGIAHYSSYNKDDLYVGLGERAAPMNLAGRGFQITASDTFGYDAYRTDPLYKHIPLLLHISPKDGSCVGVFSTAHARGTWSIGAEIDGMWGHFKVYRQAYGGLEQYLLVGASAAEVVRLYADVVGYPLLVPRYMMGYVSGGMKYSMEDEPRAADAILAFIDKCAKHDIPVSAFQMSSGYTVAETPPKTRNVFTWNHHRFPDPRAFTAACHKRGVRLLANIKPYVLANHPAYEKLKRGAAFFRDPSTRAKDGSMKPGIARLWSAGGGESGEGSHLDFTSKAGFQWWYDGCRALKADGIDAMWNDNNEFNILHDDWECALEMVPVPPSNDTTSSAQVGIWGRAMHTELMGKSSHDACVDAAPDERPLVLTRSATAGTMRYACSSWSGDNVTSWEGMRGSNALSLNASFSLLHCYGHDIGGFEGPQPTPELLVRWIQLGIYQPRFAINCYKTSAEDNLVGDVIEPWMYPSVTPLVRQALKRRYELIPYIYSLILQSHLSALPPMRWIGWGYETDPAVWASPQLLDGDMQFWLGDSLLVGGVYESSVATASVYLPASFDATSPPASAKSGVSTACGFLNVNAPYQWFTAGEWHTISADWRTSIPVLARCGGALPIGRDLPTTCRAKGATAEAEQAEFPNMALDDWRGVEIFPPPASHNLHGTFVNTWLEDDGISAEGRSPIYAITITYTVRSDNHISVQAEAAVNVPATTEGTPGWSPLWLANGLDIIMPFSEARNVKASESAAKQTVVEKGMDSRGRQVWHVEVDVKARA